MEILNINYLFHKLLRHIQKTYFLEQVLVYESFEHYFFFFLILSRIPLFVTLHWMEQQSLFFYHIRVDDRQTDTLLNN